MTVFEEALACHNMDNACLLIQTALRITDESVAACAMPRNEDWARMDIQRRGLAIAEWLAAELRYAE